MGKRVREVPSDVIIGVFSYINPNRRFYLTYPEMSNFFYRASKQEKYKDLFKEFIWDESQFHPWESETMYFAWERLLWHHVDWFSSGITWTATKDSRRKEIKNLFTKDEQSLLKSLASGFLAIFEVK